MAKPKKNQSMFDPEKEDVRPAHTTPQATIATHVHEHEHSDVDVRAIIKYTLILFASLAVVQLLLWGVFELLESRADRADAALAVSPLADTGWTFKGPQVQAYPVEDRIEFARAEDSLANTYGWIDKGTGRVRIPVDRAIDIIAEEGLPTRAEAYQSMDMGATESNGAQHQYGAVPPGARQELPKAQPRSVDTAAATTPADTSSR
jgi:hypothetical protein